MKTDSRTALSPESPGKNLPAYVLITPARNEAAFIEQTIQSVIHQKIPPSKWIIVSDGSTDRTDDIVSKYASLYPWIRLYRMPPRLERHFGGKALAFNTGYDQLRDMAFDIIGNLDADIAFDEDYFLFLMNPFAQDPSLGVAGTPLPVFQEGTRFRGLPIIPAVLF
jgi:biofilm PGA synthesis N-glycosyltransferase PgaC